MSSGKSMIVSFRVAVVIVGFVALDIQLEPGFNFF